MLKSRILLRHASSPSTSTPEYLPSKQFMYVKVKRPSQKAHFVKVASEIELFKEIYGAEAVRRLKIDDSTWKVLMEMGWEERFTYLMELRNFEQKKCVDESDENLNSNKISTKNEARWRAGEMVYARHFHSLLELYGPDFRRQIDIRYGRNVMEQGKEQRSLVVDCRFLRDYSVATQARYTNQMQALHDENWLSNRPFSINFVNYQADSQLVEIAKRNLKFQYGPPGKHDFRPHPFAPSISPRRIDAIKRKENLLYISPKATRFVPDKMPKNIEGVVICLSNESSPATSSTSACIADKVVPYRIPFQKFISAPHFSPTYLHLWQIGRIMRNYFSGETIENSIRDNMSILIRPSSAEHQNKKEKRSENEEKQTVFREAMLRINNCSTAEEPRSFSQSKKSRRF